MKIAHLTESHTVHTDRIVAHQVREGHAVRVLTFHDFVGHGPLTLIPVGPMVRRLPYAHHWASLHKVARELRTFQPDVVHGHYLTTAALYLAASPTDRIVGSAMGSDILVDSRAAHAHLLLRLLPMWVSQFTSGAPHLTRRMVELGIPAERISTFPWGVDTCIFRAETDEPPEPVIVSTRSFEPIYGIPTLLLAFARLARKDPGPSLRLFGDGSKRDYFRAEVHRLGIANRVEFLGRVPQGNIAEGLRAAKLYVSTSASDAASVSLLEAMATGLLPIVSDIEANREWIQEGENGLLFPYGDDRALEQQLERGLADETLRERARKRNPRLIADRAAWEVSMDNLRTVYGRVLGT
jgi:glycosyltransferase involved in cell wall biosynthesis